MPTKPAAVVEGAFGAGIVDGDRTGVVDDGAAAAGGDPFQRVDGQSRHTPCPARHSPRSRDHRPARWRACTSFGGLGEFAEAPRHRPPRRLQQILAIIKQADIGEPGHGDQAPVDPRALDHGWEMVGGRAARPGPR